ncbi:MAG: hypothetical protein M3Y35_08925, partial [Actinomycetota bacterium]|nr:hypothetical protein [Actinomycetota bacterium]
SFLGRPRPLWPDLPERCIVTSNSLHSHSPHRSCKENSSKYLTSSADAALFTALADRDRAAFTKL